MFEVNTKTWHERNNTIRCYSFQMMQDIVRAIYIIVVIPYSNLNYTVERICDGVVFCLHSRVKGFANDLNIISIH